MEVDAVAAALDAEDVGERLPVAADPLQELAEGQAVVALAGAAAAGLLPAGGAEAIRVGGAAAGLALGGLEQLPLAPGGVAGAPRRVAAGHGPTVNLGPEVAMPPGAFSLRKTKSPGLRGFSVWAVLGSNQ